MGKQGGEMAMYLAEAVALATVNIVSRPALTIPLFLPLSYLAGRFQFLSLPSAVLGYGTLFGLLYLALKKKRDNEESTSQRSHFKSDQEKTAKNKMKGRLESAEWVNAAVQLVWRRYPLLVAEWLRKDVVDEILEGMRRDKLFPAANGLIKNLVATKIVLRDSSPWIMDIRLNQMRSEDELSVTGRVRFVSDKDAGVELNIVCAGGINIPVKIENISVETWLNVRVHMLNQFPFVRVVWISMLERPRLELSIRPLSGVDVMHIPGLDLMLHDLILTAIEREIVLPMGKIVPIDRFMPDEYYHERGHTPSKTDAYAGKVTVLVAQTKCMLHPSHTFGASELYIRVQMAGQTFRTMPIVDTLNETLNERFEFWTSLADEDEGVTLSLVCSSSEGAIEYDSVELGTIMVREVVDGLWMEPEWVDVETLRGGNSRVQVKCTYNPLQRSLKTMDSQHSPGNEFVGGNADITMEEVREGNFVWPGRPLAGASVEVGGVVLPGAPIEAVPRVPVATESATLQGSSEPAAEMCSEVWRNLLPRTAFRGVVWVTVHEAQDLQHKVFGTRDPYVKVTVGSQSEKTRALTDTVSPVFEQELCLLVDDPVNNHLEVSVLQNDVATGRHFTDDSIGSYGMGLKQLISDKAEHQGMSGQWSGWVNLEKAKRGRLRLSLKWEVLPDAISKAKEFGGVTCGLGMGLPVAISHRPPTVYGILQVLVMAGRDCVLVGKKDRTVHPFVCLQLGEQKFETRVVRGSASPVFNEYFELYVRDPLKDRLEVRIESKDILMSDKIGFIKLPIVQIARGKVLQEWMPVSEKSSAALLVEMRLCNFDYPNQERTPQVRFDMLLEKAAKLEAEKPQTFSPVKKELSHEASTASSEEAAAAAGPPAAAAPVPETI